jgi:hypothetical protein
MFHIECKPNTDKIIISSKVGLSLPERGEITTIEHLTKRMYITAWVKML